MRGIRGNRNLLLIAILAALGLFGSTQSALACSSSGYTYAGLASPSTAYGVGARLTAIGAASVADGHVAGWVGVGGPGEGPNGSDEWIQVGLSGFAGSPDSDLYYEVTRPGSAPRYVQIEHDLPPGTSRRVAVLEVAGAPNTWRVWVDGKPVSGTIYLPQSHGTWHGVATAESWLSTGEAPCNGFGYRFENIRVAKQAGGAWQSLSAALRIRTGPNKLLSSSATSFEAISGLQNPSPVLVAGTMTRTLLASEHAYTRAQP